MLPFNRNNGGEGFPDCSSPRRSCLQPKRLLRRGALVIATASHSLITIAVTPAESCILRLFCIFLQSTTAIKPESPNVQKQCAMPWLQYRGPHAWVEGTYSCVWHPGLSLCHWVPLCSRGTGLWGIRSTATSTSQEHLMKSLFLEMLLKKTVRLFFCRVTRLGLEWQFAVLVFPAWHHRVGVCGLPRPYTRTPSHSCTRYFLFCGCPGVSTILLLVFPSPFTNTQGLCC